MLFETLTNPRLQMSRAIVAADTTQLTFDQLRVLVAGLRAAFADAGLRPGDRVVLRDRQDNRFLLRLLALLALECWVVPVQDSLTEAELEGLLRLTGGVRCPDVDAMSGEDVLVAPDPQACGVLHVTSGTTGDVKLCRRTLAACEREGAAYGEVLGLGPDDLVLSGPPISHSYSFGVVVGALSLGAAIVEPMAFVPRRMLRLTAQLKATVVLAVPVMALMLTRLQQNLPLSSVRIFLVGAGPVTESLDRDFRQRFAVALSANYGSSETGGLTTRLAAVDGAGVGRAMPGIDLRVFRDGEDLDPGEIGEVWVRGEQLMSGYWGSADIRDECSYLPTGDLGYLDHDGCLTLTGRVKRQIRVGNRTVSPIEVEEQILQFPGVEDCLVVPYLKANGHEGVCAAIVAEGAVDTQALLGFLKGRLAAYKLPQRVDQLERIPRNSMGKPVWRPDERHSS